MDDGAGDAVGAQSDEKMGADGPANADGADKGHGKDPSATGAKQKLQQFPASHNATGFVRHAELHCGGAARRPREKPQSPPPPPAPAVGKRFLVRTGTVNTDTKPVAEILSTADGTFSLQLPPGDYCVVAEDKRHVAHNPTTAKLTGVSQWYDATCLENWPTLCDYQWTVTPERQHFLLADRRGCFEPCYFGPPPP